MASVIFLNGASSAGKTSLGTALQDVLDEPYLLLGLDTCFQTVPARWAGGPRGPYRHLGFEYLELPPEDGHPVLGIGYGPIGWRIMAGFHRAVAEIVRSGNPVIVDEMLLDERVRDDWLAVLAPFKPLLVGVHCALDELERRERGRAHRPGVARWSARRVHAGINYDMIVDTTAQTSISCAGTILERIKEGIAGIG
ncbi:MAG TPA: AAA family ATPase [Thermomicrobiales bacterium]|nr:AAA family ATPase [Thermomicrobiales bacterium]